MGEPDQNDNARRPGSRRDLATSAWPVMALKMPMTGRVDIAGFLTALHGQGVGIDPALPPS